MLPVIKNTVEPLLSHHPCIKWTPPIRRPVVKVLKIFVVLIVLLIKP